ADPQFQEECERTFPQRHQKLPQNLQKRQANFAFASSCLHGPCAITVSLAPPTPARTRPQDVRLDAGRLNYAQRVPYNEIGWVCCSLKKSFGRSRFLAPGTTSACCGKRTNSALRSTRPRRGSPANLSCRTPLQSPTCWRT